MESRLYLPQESTAKYYLAVVRDIINIKTDGIILKKLHIRRQTLRPRDEIVKEEKVLS